MKPMLAATLKKGTEVRFPLLLSPKLDGVRCLIVSGRAVSRSLKPIPNAHTQFLFGRKELTGLDGELIVGPPTAEDAYRRTVSGVMKKEGEPEVAYHVFDKWDCHRSDRLNYLLPFSRRLERASLQIPQQLEHLVKFVPHRVVEDHEELLRYEERCIEAGYEGVMLRDPEGPYKFGRSTEREGYLLKLKRFVDAEAVVLGVEEHRTNTNERKVDELGRNRRTSHKAGKVASGKLGALLVRDRKTGVEFSIGSGFTDAEREALWLRKRHLIGKAVKYKSQPTGVKSRPRFPVFLGLRHPEDM